MNALRTIDTTGSGPMFVDFRLGELRLVSDPSLAIPFNDLCEATKRDVRALRAEYGPNCHIPGLDD